MPLPTALAAPPQRLNPTRVWVVAWYALPLCGVWCLSFLLPWWAWTLLAVALSTVVKRAGSLPCAGGGHSQGRGERMEERRGGRWGDGVLLGEGWLLQCRDTALPAAPERFLGLWAGCALCFAAYSAYVGARLAGIGSSQFGPEAFAGGSLRRGGQDEAGAGSGGIDMLAWVSVGLMAAVLLVWGLCLVVWADWGGGGWVLWWPSRHGGSGAGGMEGGWGKGSGRGWAGAQGVGVGGHRWRERGDPGAVWGREEAGGIGALIEEVVSVGGAPDKRRWCHTCLVKKPLRSKHCAQCGFCVGRMDHHCVWLNNCVGAGNNRAFCLFVLLHLAYTAIYLQLAVGVWVAEIT
ncbi:unnamed protein product, partial [Discosporangium mesarthrocarpum]